MRRMIAVAMLLLPTTAVAQDEAAPGIIPTVEQQIAAAVLPLPDSAFQATATVMGYRTAGTLEMLRATDGPMICLADNPTDPPFHVACYHRSLEPFMARGRELRTQGISNVDSMRYPEVESGKLPMPNRAALWSLTGPAGSMDYTTMTTGEGVRALYVVYIPGATPESTGLPATPGPNSPWLMFPGTPKAHIMFIPSM